MLFQVCCETGFSRLNLIMTKMRNNLLVVTLDALMMLFINGPSLEPDVPSPTIELSELCKLGYLHWTKAKNRNSRRCHHMSRARAHDVTAEHHNVYKDAPVFRLFLHDDCEDEGEEGSKQGSQQADEGEGEAIEEDDETTFGLVGPYKPPANWEVVPEETVANSMERGLQLQGFIRGRKVVHLFKHPDGWSEGMFTRRCIREGQPSDIYSIKYDDGTAFDQPCVRTTYGTGLGKRWCIIQPIQS